MIVIGADSFSKRLAEILDIDFVLVERKTFPDGETRPRLTGDFSDEHVILVNRMPYPVDPNRYLMETLLLLKMLKSKAKKIDLVMPYLVYGRQDKIFREGEPLSSRYVLEMLHSAGASRLFTVSSHAERDKEMLSAPMPAYNINGFIAVAEYLEKMKLKDFVIIGADTKAAETARFVAEKLNTKHASLAKHRDVNTGEISFGSELHLDGTDVVIVDDMVTSGGTMINAIDLCKQAGCGNIIAACVHPVLVGNALENISPRVSKFVATDTLESPIREVSVVPLIADRIRDGNKNFSD